MVDLYQDKWIDEKADIWALGCVLYKILYDVTPFENGSKLKIINAEVEFPTSSKYSQNIHALVKFMLDPNPDTRPDIDHVMEHTAKLLNISHKRLIPEKTVIVSTRVQVAPTKKTIPQNKQSQSGENFFKLFDDQKKRCLSAKYRITQTIRFVC